MNFAKSAVTPSVLVQKLCFQTRLKAHGQGYRNPYLYPAVLVPGTRARLPKPVPFPNSNRLVIHRYSICIYEGFMYCSLFVGCTCDQAKQGVGLEHRYLHKNEMLGLASLPVGGVILPHRRTVFHCDIWLLTVPLGWFAKMTCSIVRSISRRNSTN